MLRVYYVCINEKILLETTIETTKHNMQVHPGYDSRKTRVPPSTPSHEQLKTQGYYTNTPQKMSALQNPAPPGGSYFYDLGMQACEPCVSSTTNANWCVYPSIMQWSGEDKPVEDLETCRNYLNTNLSAVRRTPKRARPRALQGSVAMQADLTALCGDACEYVAFEDIDQDTCDAAAGECTPGWHTCSAGSACGFQDVTDSGVCTVQALDAGDTCCDGETAWSTQESCENANAVDSDQGDILYIPQCNPGETSLGCCWTNSEDCDGMFA